MLFFFLSSYVFSHYLYYIFLAASERDCRAKLSIKIEYRQLNHYGIYDSSPTAISHSEVFELVERTCPSALQSPTLLACQVQKLVAVGYQDGMVEM